MYKGYSESEGDLEIPAVQRDSEVQTVVVAAPATSSVQFDLPGHQIPHLEMSRQGGLL